MISGRSSLGLVVLAAGRLREKDMTMTKRDYPVTALGWATVPGNPTLAAHRRTGRAVVGGLPAKPGIASITAEALAERAQAAIREMEGRWLLVGLECSINPDTPEPLMHAVGAAVRASR